MPTSKCILRSTDRERVYIKLRSSLNVIVQPSVPWMDLNAKIQDTGLFFPIDPGPSVRQYQELHNLSSAANSFA